MTIQQVISKASALNNLVILLAESLLIAELSADLLRSVRELGTDMGAGFFPNTFTKDGVYRLVHNEREQAVAVADGWRVATFPETMIKAGFPDLVVHNSVQKTLANKDGYRLPGLGVESGS
jgi:hypothetical protein